MALAVVALLAVGCSAQASLPAASVMPGGIPTPNDAAVVVGQGGGVDAGAPLYGFSSDLSPGQALQEYAAQLLLAGFAPAGQDGAWHLYARGRQIVAVQVGENGPPTDLLVRLLAAQAGKSPGAARTHPPTAGNGGNGNGGNGNGGNATLSATVSLGG